MFDCLVPPTCCLLALSECEHAAAAPCSAANIAVSSVTYSLVRCAASSVCHASTTAGSTTQHAVAYAGAASAALAGCWCGCCCLYCCRFSGFSRRNDSKHVVFMGAVDDGPTMAGVGQFVALSFGCTAACCSCCLRQGSAMAGGRGSFCGPVAAAVLLPAAHVWPCIAATQLCAAACCCMLLAA